MKVLLIDNSHDEVDELSDFLEGKGWEVKFKNWSFAI